MHRWFLLWEEQNVWVDFEEVIIPMGIEICQNAVH